MLKDLFKNYNLSQIISLPNQYKDIIFACSILGIVGVLLFPVAPAALDLLLCISIAISIIILITVLLIDVPLDFSAFPSILLVVTMLRLSLNISTTRLILAHGHMGTDAAGQVVKAFGYFVIEGSVIIGSIIFIILTIINFVVITKGSGRIAEVAARFSLDAMPGKQMAIDADLSAGLIKEEEARNRRKRLEDESTFFGSMDGANKFVRGDAIAGLLITIINLIGGILIGIVQKDMSLAQAVHTYTILTIGDGLVTQVPALLVSISAGLLVTKSGIKGSIDQIILTQLSQRPNALALGSVLLAIMGILIPGIPPIPFLAIAGICGITAYFINKKQTKPNSTLGTDNDSSNPNAAKSEDQIILDSLQVDNIKIEIGYELLPLIAPNESQKITGQIKKLRQRIAKELGFILPAVRIVDNIELKPQQYNIKVKDVECGQGSILHDHIMIMDPKGNEISIPGQDTVEPAFGLSARWVLPSARDEANFKGYTIVEPSTVMITHLTEIVKDNITELLTYGEVNILISNLAPEHKKLSEDIIPQQISLVVVQRVLQRLLKEGVAIRDLGAILEAISEISARSPGISQLIEHVRQSMSRQISATYTNSEGHIPIVVLSPNWEQMFIEHIIGEGENKQLALPPSKLKEFVIEVNQIFKELMNVSRDITPIILTSPSIRPFVYSVIERFKANIVVISQNEIHPRASIKTLGQIK